MTHQAQGPPEEVVDGSLGVASAWSLLEVATALVGATTRGEVVERVLGSGVPLTGASGGAVLLLDAEGEPAGAGGASGEEPAMLRWSAPGGVAEGVPAGSDLPETRAARTGRVVAAVSAADVARRFPELVAGGSAPAAAAAVPLRVRGSVLGALAASWASPPPSEAAVLLEALGAVAAQALGRVAADEQRDRALADVEDARARLAVLSEVGRVLAATASGHVGEPALLGSGPDEEVLESTSVDRSVGALARLVVPALGDWCLVTLVDEHGRWREGGHAHRDPARAEEVAALGAALVRGRALGASLAGPLRSRRPVVVERISEAEVAAAIPDAATAAAFSALDPCGTVLLPLGVRDRTVGSLLLVTSRERGPHTPAELETAAEVARRAGGALDSAVLFRAQKRLAEGLQRSMLTPPPRLPGLEVAVRYEPSARRVEVGGDWYDVLVQPSGSPVVVIGDVMGHDVAAAAGMGQLRSLLRGIAYTTDEPPDEVLARTDAAMDGLGLGTIATALVGRLDDLGPRGWRLVWSNAGHPPPVVLRADGRAEIAPGDHDLLLGVRPTTARTPVSVLLAPGDVLVLCTDGLLERRDQGVDVGQARLLEVLSALSADERRSAQRLCDVVLEACAPGPREDDVALVAVRVL
ncbi:PP2C family protein-serine/threonine phosphatase [uncultured Pseudokineococcus sp.]|uniref:PP2C family protein-serine/threonine phosphatase n=1 Tax=uncultured Pseudokineococcus sp. TaxID=1642928 RepID=UPI00260B0F28|nr:GAF domain-containing SpoIIE family protein phosphatase [uncultured Pseudokineococcus sp.]